MTGTTEMTRLAAARPAIATRTNELSSPLERARVLESILFFDAGHVSPRSAPRRPRLRRSLLPVAAAVATLLAVTVATDDSSRGGPQIGTGPSAAPAPTVVDRIELALISHHDSVVRIESDHGNGVVWETWVDSDEDRWRSLSRRADGRSLYEHEISGDDSHISAVVVNHEERTWWTYAGPGERAGVPHPTPDEIRAHLAEGRLEEVGRTAEEIHLRSRPVEKRADAQVLVAVGDLWVDATTFLPRRSSVTAGGTSSTARYTWLPRTEESVASTRLTVPPGYRQLDHPPAG